MNEDRLQKKREKDLVQNLNEDQSKRKRKKDIVQNLNEDRVKRKGEEDIVQNLNEDRLKKKREKYIVQNLNENRLKRKRVNDIVDYMTTDRINKRRRVQQVNKIWRYKTSYVHFGDMNYTCSHCSAKSCCHFEKVKLSPLAGYDENLKKIIIEWLKL